MSHEKVQGNHSKAYGSQNDKDYVEDSYDDQGLDLDVDFPDEYPEPGSAKYPKSGGAKAYGAGPKNYGSGGVAQGGDFDAPPSPAELAFIKQLAKSGKSYDEAAELYYEKYGKELPPYEYNFGQQGYKGYGSGSPAPYYHNPSYGPKAGEYYKSWGEGTTSGMMKMFMDDQMNQDTHKSVRDMKKKEQEAKIKMHAIMFLLMSGQIDLAIRCFTILANKEAAQFTGLMVKKLGAVSRARQRIIRSFAMKSPPKAYAGTNAQTAARAQDKSAKYTQYVQLTTQAMNELSQGQNEILDGIQRVWRDADQLWQQVASMRDDAARTKERVLRTG